jgi:hypothetical protein
MILLGRFPGDPDIERAKAEFAQAQAVEERFHHDFNRIDFTRSVVGGRFAYLLRCNYWEPGRSMVDPKELLQRMAST